MAITALPPAPLNTDTKYVFNAKANALVAALPAFVEEANSLGANPVTVDGNLILGKASGIGIKVDLASPTFPWKSLVPDIAVRGTGASDPTFGVYTGTSFRAYSFSSTVMQEIFIAVNIPHDYVQGTGIYLHAHWSNAAATPNTGNVVWGFEYAYAKGHNQAAMPASTTVTATQASVATRWQHLVAEPVVITNAAFEPDGLLLIRLFRDAAAGGDTCTDAVFLHFAGIHYQSNVVGTKQRAPNYYV